MTPTPRTWSVYLSGEIHSDWRERIEAGAREAGLPVSFSAPVTDHAASDDAGTGTLGEEDEAFWRDHKGAGVNAIRTQTLIRAADLGSNYQGQVTMLSKHFEEQTP